MSGSTPVHRERPRDDRDAWHGLLVITPAGMTLWAVIGWVAVWWLG